MLLLCSRTALSPQVAGDAAAVAGAGAAERAWEGPSCVTLDELCHLPVPQFPYPHKEDIGRTTSRGVVGIKQVVHEPGTHELVHEVSPLLGLLL